MSPEPGKRVLKVFVFCWLPFLLYIGLISWGSSHVIGVKWAFRYDKLIHICEFTVFAVLLSRALVTTFSGLRGRDVIMITCVLGFLYGTIDEYQQSFVPGRVADLMDAAADAAGSAFGAFVYALYLKITAIRKDRQTGVNATD